MLKYRDKLIPLAAKPGLVAIMVMAFILPAKADPQDRLNISGFVRAQTAVSLESRNPNNTAVGLQADQDLNQAKIFAVTDFDYRPAVSDGGIIDGFRFYMRTRFNWDLTQDISSGLSDYDAFPTSYKDDWTLARVGGTEMVGEIWEVFADIEMDNLWLRLGRQNIVWGEADAIRLLDIVNPLDLTQHLFIEGGGEQFDHIRIPIWAARATLNLPFWPGFSIDGYINPGDFVPTQLPANGSPYNLTPFSSPVFIIADDTDSRRGDIQGGVRLLGQVGNVNFTLNYLNKIDEDGVLQNTALGFPGPFGPFGPPFITLSNVHERLHILGASFNSFIAPLGLVFRGELAHTLNQPYIEVPAPFALPRIIERDTTKFVLGFDRPTFILNKDRAMNISLQYFQTIREDGPESFTVQGSPGDLYETNFSLYLSQPTMSDQLFYELLAVADTDGAYWLQPQIRYAPGDDWRFAVYGNFFGGGEKRAGRLGSLDWANEINASITYQF